MEYGSAAHTYLIPPVWTTTWGWNWDMLFNYVMGLLVSGFLFGKQAQAFVDTVFNFLKAQVNKIQFDLPLPLGYKVRIDFARWTWDDAFFDATRDFVKMKIASKESDAKRLKLEYKPKLEAAKTEEERLRLHAEYHDKLMDLTSATVDDMKTFEPQLFRSAITRFKDEMAAEEWVKNLVKAEVANRKNGSDTKVSITKTLLDTTSNETETPDA